MPAQALFKDRAFFISTGEESSQPTKNMQIELSYQYF